MIMVTAPMSARFAERFGTRAVVATGLAIVAAGLGIASTLGVDSPYWLLALSLVVLAIGMGLTMPPSTTAIMSSLPMGKAGVGSAVNDTTRELGGALGVAVLGSLAASHYAAAVGRADGSPVRRRPRPAGRWAPPSRSPARSAASGAPPWPAAAKTAFVDAMGVSLDRRRSRRAHRRRPDRPVHAGPGRCRSRPAGHRRRADRAVGSLSDALATASPASARTWL